MKTLFLFAVTFLTALFTTAQNNLPENLNNAIPSNYDITLGQYVKSDFVVSVSISLTLPGENACDEGLEQPVIINIEVLEMNDNYIVQMQEEQIPFVSILPTKESLRNENDENGLIVYDQPEVVDVDGGRLVYCAYTVSCIMSENESCQGVEIIAMQGSYARRVSLELGGAISPDKAISISKNLLATFSTVNLSETE